MVPNDFDVGSEAAGSLNCGWLNALMKSARNCRLRLSLSLVFFNAERSNMLMPGPRIPENRVERARTLLPSLSLVLVSKTGLNHW